MKLVILSSLAYECLRLLYYDFTEKKNYFNRFLNELF